MIYPCCSDKDDSSDLWSEAQAILDKAIKDKKLFLYDENYTYGINSFMFSSGGQINIDIHKEARE